MNYHRRTTRPDAAFYRDSRKIARSGRGGGGGNGKGGLSPLAIAIGLIVVAALVYYLLHR